MLTRCSTVQYLDDSVRGDCVRQSRTQYTTCKYSCGDDPLFHAGPKGPKKFGSFFSGDDRRLGEDGERRHVP